MDIVNDSGKQMILRSLLLIKELLNESEKNGIGSLKSLAGLSRGDLLTLTIANEISSEPKTIELKIYSSKTFHELKQEIAKLLSIPISKFKIQRST
jgi:hypothetical protein